MVIHFKLLKSLPVQLFITIIIALFTVEQMSVHQKSLFYTISLNIKEILMFFIPFIILTSIFGAFINMNGGILTIIILLLSSVIISNLISVSIAGISVYSGLIDIKSYNMAEIDLNKISPLWNLVIPKILANNVALFMGFSLALFYKIFPIDIMAKIIGRIENICHVFLHKFFMPVLPLFIFGFLIKLVDADIIEMFIKQNYKSIISMLILLIGYLTILYFIANLITNKGFLFIARNLINPAITAFSTMSSAAALPFSLKAAEANTEDKLIANSVMPTTVNIHMIGDAICIPIMAMMIIKTFNLAYPSYYDYGLFAVLFVLTKFSGVGVPGGTILVMIPILEKYLGFNSDMIMLITLFYMLVDPITTFGNVIGNNLFVIIFKSFYNNIVDIVRCKASNLS